MIDQTELVGMPDRELLMVCSVATHQHFKGGLYRLLGDLYDADTGERALAPDGDYYIAYEHVYPHERKIWKRKSREFYGEKNGEPRFRELGS